MAIFTSKMLAWWQIGILKLSLLSIGIAVGAYWSESFISYAGTLAILGVALGLYVAFVWLKK